MSPSTLIHKICEHTYSGNYGNRKKMYHSLKIKPKYTEKYLARLLFYELCYEILLWNFSRWALEAFVLKYCCWPFLVIESMSFHKPSVAYMYFLIRWRGCKRFCYIGRVDVLMNILGKNVKRRNKNFSIITRHGRHLNYVPNILNRNIVDNFHCTVAIIKGKRKKQPLWKKNYSKLFGESLFKTIKNYSHYAPMVNWRTIGRTIGRNY